MPEVQEHHSVSLPLPILPMNEPKRMTVTWKELGGGLKDKTEWVSLEDYTRLQAEVARLRAGSFVTAVPAKHYERIIKAGDAVVADLEHLTKSCWFDKCQSVKRWNNAKKGK